MPFSSNTFFATPRQLKKSGERVPFVYDDTDACSQRGSFLRVRSRRGNNAEASEHEEHARSREYVRRHATGTAAAAAIKKWAATIIPSLARARLHARRKERAGLLRTERGRTCGGVHAIITPTRQRARGARGWRFTLALRRRCARRPPTTGAHEARRVWDTARTEMEASRAAGN